MRGAAYGDGDQGGNKTYIEMVYSHCFSLVLRKKLNTRLVVQEAATTDNCRVAAIRIAAPAHDPKEDT